jgi:hypothetical protein
VFRRRRNDDEDLFDETDLDEEYLDEEDDDDTPPPLVRPTGPWDIADVSDDLERIDFGALHVHVREGHELRVDINPETQTPLSLNLASPSSVMQIMVFAAPRTTGIWADVRAEIAASLRGSGAVADETTGPYGPELRAQVPTDQPGQLAPARFVGVDGPRWFLRAMVQGRAAVDPSADADLLAAFADIVVDRGADAMAVRDPLPLRLPKDIQQQVEQHAEAEAQKPTLDLLERGPEITETR